MLIKRFMKEKQFYNFDANLKQALSSNQDGVWSGPFSGIPAGGHKSHVVGTFKGQNLQFIAFSIRSNQGKAHMLIFFLPMYHSHVIKRIYHEIDPYRRKNSCGIVIFQEL